MRNGVDPRYRQRGQIAEALASAWMANRNARQRVRQGVPPDHAASQATMATMVAGTMGIVFMLVFCPAALITLGGGAYWVVPGLLVMAYSFFTCYCMWIFIRIAPHRMSPFQAKCANLWTIFGLTAGIFLVVPLAIILSLLMGAQG